MTAARIASFGQYRGDYRVEDYRALPEGGAEFSIRGVPVRLAMEGRHQALNAAAALAACEFAGVPLGTGASALAAVNVEHRLQELPARGGYVIVDDAYNASPESMLAAFEAMRESAHEGRLLAVLGEMRELGHLAAESHQRVGHRAAEVFDALCVVDIGNGGILAEAAGAELVPDRDAAAEWVRRNARTGDRVLIKASHGMHLEEVVRELTAS
jgi:UDP-N-acetylmuramyl pentapeptide synthase